MRKSGAISRHCDGKTVACRLGLSRMVIGGRRVGKGARPNDRRLHV